MKEITERMEKFDKPRGWYTGDIPVEKRTEWMEWMITGLAGELGEVAGPIHKYRRDIKHSGFSEERFNKLKEEIEEELADVFIFLKKLANLVDVDLKQAVLNKIEKNEKKHGKYLK